MSVRTHTDQMRALIYTVAHTHTAQTRSLALNWNHLCLKNSWTTAISASLDTSAGLLWISKKFLPACIQWLHWPQPCVISQKKKKGKKPQSTSSYKERAFEGIRMHIDITGPWAITGLIFLPDKQSASLWAFSWHLTSAFPTEPSLLMQKTKCLRGLLNIQYLNCLTIIFFFNGPFKDSISEWMQRMAIEERALRDAEEEE